MNDLRLITTYAVDIDLVGGDQIREYETQYFDKAKEYFDEISKDMKYGGMEVYNIQLVAVNGLPGQYLDYAVIESKFNEWYDFEDEPRYMCQNCGGGFLAEEMDFDVEDTDLCKNCNHISYNDSPYGEDN
jgi:hypothetical protein